MKLGRALVIGIDSYPGFGPESQLFGGVRDAQVMAELLTARFDVQPGNVVSLLGPEATRAAILAALEDLRLQVKPDDQVMVFFSGHGSQMTDREGDEGDGLDETLVPVDSGRGEAENRDISDDEINHWAARVLEVTPNLTLIFDCCHSATLHRPGWRVRSVPPDLRPVEALPPSPVPNWRDVETGPRPLLIAACRDDEQAYEAPPSVAGEYRGILSLYLIEAMRDVAPDATWREVFNKASSAIAGAYGEQHPQISGDGLDLPIFAEARSILRGVDAGTSLLALADRPDPFGLTMRLFRSRGGAWRRTDNSAFVAGDRLRVDLSHQHSREIFIYLFDIGVTGSVTLLFPDFDGHEVLDPRTVLTVGARRGDALELYFPDDFAAEQNEGVGHLLLIGAASRLSTARLLAGSVAELRDQGEAASAVVSRYRLRRG